MASNPWPKYLRSIEINGIRGWNGEEIRFGFPVTVIAGENGTGKSTIIKAAACAYGSPEGKKKTYFPSTFFRIHLGKKSRVQKLNIKYMKAVMYEIFHMEKNRKVETFRAEKNS